MALMKTIILIPFYLRVYELKYEVFGNIWINFFKNYTVVIKFSKLSDFKQYLFKNK